MSSKADGESEGPKPLFWVASSRENIQELPKGVRTVFGQALFDAQTGEKHPCAKPMKGFGGAGVLEVVEDDSGSTYRAVYTVRFPEVVYVLHVFQKKSKVGSKTPAADINRIRERLKVAESSYAEYLQ